GIRARGTRLRLLRTAGGLALQARARGHLLHRASDEHRCRMAAESHLLYLVAQSRSHPRAAGVLSGAGEHDRRLLGLRGRARRSGQPRLRRRALDRRRGRFLEPDAHPCFCDKLPAMSDARPLSDDELRRMHAWWRAANYLSVGQIYLLDNPLLRQPLKLEHTKPRLLGHWGTTPGLNFIYVHLNRIINARDVNMIYIAGPGHGGPGLVANTYLEGTYCEMMPHISPDADGLQKLFKQFSFPGGIPSHVAPETPGSIHEGGELGYALVHAYGAVFDNPDLVAACIVGDGEAESGPLAASWHSNKFLNPVRDGAVVPILHLNGYKIANPSFLARLPRQELESLFVGYGYRPYFVEGDDPPAMHQLMASTLDEVFDSVGEIQADARANGFRTRPVWPMIVLRTPKGWTGPKEVDGQPTEGSWRSHQVPFADLAAKPSHLG